jgi:CMP-N-acetylneuraminic acid synthetase
MPRYLGIIPARGGSKRLPGKNTKLLCGSPLISYTIRAAQESCLDDYFVSTEDPHIRDVALSYGSPVMHRPLSLAQDDTTTGEVAAHAVEAMEADGHKFDAVVILHPTSPLRTAQHIDEAIEAYEEFEWRTALASTKLLLKKNKPRRNRTPPSRLPQGRWHSDCEIMNAAIYIVNAEEIKKTRQHALADMTYIMDHKSSIDIDDELDFKIAEMIMKDRLNENKGHNQG